MDDLTDTSVIKNRNLQPPMVHPKSAGPTHGDLDQTSETSRGLEPASSGNDERGEQTENIERGGNNVVSDDTSDQSPDIPYMIFNGDEFFRER